MALEQYKQKRRFDKTPEPTGGKPTEKTLRFVVQKHHASHLHYDFRLELRGVLKSWAVPKGISMNPSESRLAMLVEDHPWDYRNFEGIIPSGYGKGTVIVWDEGTYETDAITETDKKAQEHSITSQFWKGHIDFTLHGKKVKGKFTIGKAKDKDDNSWYIHKVQDSYASKKDITEHNESVQSGKTLEQVAAKPAKEWQSHKPAKASKPVKEITAKEPMLGTKATMPESMKPMLCTLIKEPFNDAAWLYEVKWDGYRIIAFSHKGKVVLKSRGDQDYTHKYEPITKAIEELQLNAVIDGEVVVLDDKGEPDFSALQNYKRSDTIVYYVFDIVWYNGNDLKDVPLEERKKLLQDIIPFNETIRFSDSFDDGFGLFDSVQQMGLEGIVAKRKDSIYTPGKKGNTWYKAKLSERKEYVIGGWTESDNNRQFRSLMFGHYVDGKFTYVHHSGGGFTEKQLKELSAKLHKLETDVSPFVNKVDIKARKHWVKPELVAEFDKSVQTTKIGVIRHPAIFIGLRDDKKAKDVIEEVAKKVRLEDNIRGMLNEKQEHQPTETGSWEILDKRTITSENELEVDGHTIDLINIERELWPGITKADLIRYYISLADYILPHLKDRPLGLNICMGSAAKGGFFIRGMEGKAPKWADIFTTERKHKAKGKSDTIEWLVCNDKATLVYLLNLESVDIHPWTSRTETPEQPDYIVIDLDPSDDDFKKVIATAQAAKKVFDKKKLISFVKTSGKTGLHLLLPCSGINFGESRKIAEKICEAIHKEVPDITTTNVSVNSRGNLLYIDPNQNDYADRVAAPYCVRAYHLPTVSTPLHWKEVNAKLNPHDFTLETMAERLTKKGDLFKDILNAKSRKSNSIILKQFI